VQRPLVHLSGPRGRGLPDELAHRLEHVYLHIEETRWGSDVNWEAILVLFGEAYTRGITKVVPISNSL
jgi:hypothetical protein